MKLIKSVIVVIFSFLFLSGPLKTAPLQSTPTKQGLSAYNEKSSFLAQKNGLIIKTNTLFTIRVYESQLFLYNSVDHVIAIITPTDNSKCGLLPINNITIDPFSNVPVYQYLSVDGTTYTMKVIIDRTDEEHIIANLAFYLHTTKQDSLIAVISNVSAVELTHPEPALRRINIC